MLISIKDILQEVSMQYDLLSYALPHIEEETADFLTNIIAAKKAQNILEIGTCLGYSTIVLANSVREYGGRVVTIEINDDLFWRAKKNIEKAGLKDYVDMICADASEAIPFLKTKYDIIFQDGQKGMYVTMLDNLLDKLRSDGVIIADDTLLDLTNPYKSIRKAIRDYNSLVFSRNDLISTILPIGDGLTLSAKKF
jgi:predicted O-methyltransferase YrrM